MLRSDMADFDRMLLTVNQAKGLPNEHYICEQTFEREKQAVLFDNWAGIGFGKDIPEPGDARPITFLGMPLLVVRDRDGSIGVFQNTCRHRGMILVDTPRKARGAIRCPYHSWCYALNGALRATPHVGGPDQHTHDDIDRDALGLFRVRSDVWRDVIFVNVSGTAAAFADYAARLIERWGEFDQPIRPGASPSSVTLEVRTNWKLAVENYCESYHLPFVHPELNAYSRLEDHYPIEEQTAFSGQGTLVYQQLKDDQGRTFPDFDGLGRTWQEGAEYIALYPNVLFGVHRDHAFAIILEPVAVDRTREHIELYYPETAADAPHYPEMCAANAQQWKTVFEEDIHVVEGMQRGRHGPLFDGGKFSPAMDGPTHCFHRWVAEQVTRAGSPDPS